MKKFKPYLIIIGVLLLIATVSLVLFKTIGEEEEVKYSTEDEKYQVYYDNLVKKTMEQRVEYGQTKDVKDLHEALPYFDLYFNDINIALLTEDKRNDYEDIYPLMRVIEEEFKSESEEEKYKNMLVFFKENENYPTQLYYHDLVESYDTSSLLNINNITAKSIDEIKGMSEEEKYLKKIK